MLMQTHFALSNFDEPNHQLKELFEIFRTTLNKNMTYREFRFFYFRHRPHFMDVSFLKDGNKTVGFICVAFYYHDLEGKRYTICRGAAGIHEDYRGGKLPSGLLCSKYIRYKLRHPFEKMYITGYMANPILYSMICRYTHKVYPKQGVPVTPEIENLRDKLINYYGHQKKVIAPFVLKIHFQVHINAKDEQRIYESDDKNIKFYLSLNPNFQQQYGVMTIVPVSWSNVLISALRFGFLKPLKKMLKSKQQKNSSGKWNNGAKKQALPNLAK